VGRPAPWSRQSWSLGSRRRPLTIQYVDTSALVKRVVVEQESPDVRRLLREANAAGDVVAASELAWLEVWRTLRRASVDDLESAATAALRGIDEIPLTTDILVRARRIGPAMLRSLDAIQLASAVAIGATTVVTYDDRMARAAAEFGFEVIGAARG
jgi:predicted nucleic acid-binding protein